MISYNPRDPLMDRAVMIFDPANVKSFAKNVVPNPLDIFAWCGGVPANCTLSRDTTTTKSPVGGIPIKMTSTANDPHMISYASAPWSLTPAASGQTWTMSVYVKASVASSIQLLMFATDSSHTTVVQGVGTTIAVGTTWARVSTTITLNISNIQYLQVRLDGNDARDGSTIGQSFWFDGLQVEQGSTPRTFSSLTNTGGTQFVDLDQSILATMYGAVPFDTDGGGCFNFAGNTGAQANLASLGFSMPTSPIPRTGNYAISAWVKNPVASNTQATILSNAGGGDGYRFGAHATGIYALVGPPFAEGTSSFTFVSNTWYHIMVVADRMGLDTGSARIAFYLNGSLNGSIALGMPQTQATSAVPGIVRNGHGGGTYTGKLGMLSAYTGHVTASEVQQLFASQRGRYGV